VYINKYTGTGGYIKMYIYYKQIQKSNKLKHNISLNKLVS